MELVESTIRLDIEGYEYILKHKQMVSQTMFLAVEAPPEDNIRWIVLRA